MTLHKTAGLQLDTSNYFTPSWLGQQSSNSGYAEGLGRYGSLTSICTLVSILSASSFALIPL